jgi:hypothetical protein
MRFRGHVPDSLRNKNMERHIPYLLLKMVFWPLKLWCPLRVHGEKNFFVNFESYDLVNGEE